jgi:hypothetical protein
MSKVGPPSGGYRFGGDEAFRTRLPPKAANPQGKPTGAELQARQTLDKFTAYYERARSIGKPIPATQGISKRRADVLKRREELEQHERDGDSISVINGKYTKLRLHWAFGQNGKYWFYIEEDVVMERKRRSKRYFSREGAIRAFDDDHITWVRTIR